MLKYIFFIELLIVVLLSGCNNNQTGGNVPVIDLEDAFDNNCEYVKLSKYCKSIEYIPLETSYESVLGTNIKRQCNIRADSNYVFIKDEQTFGIRIFSNKTGQHIKTFNKRGRGPGEYPNFYFWDLRGEYNSDNFRIALQYLNSVFMYGKEGNFLYKIAADYGDPWVSPTVFTVILTPNEEDNYIYTLDSERHYNPQKGGNDIYEYLVSQLRSTGAGLGCCVDGKYKDGALSIVFAIGDLKSIDVYKNTFKGEEEPALEMAKNAVLFNLLKKLRQNDLKFE